MAKAKKAAKAAKTTLAQRQAREQEARDAKQAERDGAKAEAGKGDTAKAGVDVEQPMTEEKQLKTIAEERLESDQTMRVDGTTPRHTEPLGVPAPGQGGRPGPERRVAPQGGLSEAAAERTPEQEAERRAELGERFKVEALRMGYTENVRRRAGDVFTTTEKEFSERWMRRVDGGTPEKVTSAPKALKKFHDETLADRAGHTRATSDKAPAKSSGDADVLDR